MATTTPNIGLTLPSGTEGWKRSIINGNFTILDTKIGAVGNTPLQDQINTLSSQITGLIVYAEYTIANNNTAQDFSYPTGLNSGNCIMEGIKIYTRYNSWVDPLYANGDYFGNLIYVAGDDTSKFRYTPKTAGNGTKIGITFIKTV